jgi:FMN phosphatase YigB (HAD superfamily)
MPDVLVGKRDGSSHTVVFDLGGVLLTGGLLTADGEARALGRLERHLQVPRDAAAATWAALQAPCETGSVPEWTLWERFAAGNPTATASKVWRELVLMVHPIPEGVAVLRRCHALGWRTALATNHFPSWLEEWRRRYSWIGYLDPIVSSTVVGVRKPDPLFFVHLRERVDAQGGWFVDDRFENVVAAWNAGLRPVWARGPGDWQVFASDPADGTGGLSIGPLSFPKLAARELR